MCLCKHSQSESNRGVGAGQAGGRGPLGSAQAAGNSGAPNCSIAPWAKGCTRSSLGCRVSVYKARESLADREWLDEATKTVSRFCGRKKPRRNGLTVANNIQLVVGPCVVQVIPESLEIKKVEIIHLFRFNY